jgi:hypothetical protein
MDSETPQDGVSRLQEILDRGIQRAYGVDAGTAIAQRRAISALPEWERDELDAHLAASLADDDSDDSALLAELEEILGDDPRALTLLQQLRTNVARTALRCVELSYLYGKRRGAREALDLLLPYIAERSLGR